MTNRRKLLILIIMLTFLCLGIFSGCTTNNNNSNSNGDDIPTDEEKMIGKWENDKTGDIFNFYSNSTYTDPQGIGHYQLENNTIIFTETSSALEKIAKYQFEGDYVLIITYISPVNISGTEIHLVRKS